jgi:hypothetical protein
MSADNFRSAIRAAIRGLWTGALSDAEFDEVMRTAIEREFWLAFAEGIGGCGYTLADLEPEELDVVTNAIASNEDYIDNFSLAIQTEQLYGGSLDKVMERGELWINRYREIVSLGRVTICGDQRLEWVLGKTEEHCESCAKLNGIVKRAKFWESHNVHPQGAPNDMIECGGWRCDCSLKPTTKPVTRGSLPSLP